MRTTGWLVVTIGLSQVCGASPRQAVSLNGDWEMVKVRSLDAPPAAGWQAVRVPGTVRGYNYERAWFRRRFSIPADWQNRRLRVHFGGVKYNSRVRVNGRDVGACFNGYDAFDVDITASARVGADNELLVAVHDWTGLFTGKPVDFDRAARGREVRNIPQDRILGPIGGLYAQYGLWGDVTLDAVPAVHFTDLFFRPSVRQSRVDVDVTVVNAARQPFQADVHARLFRWDGSARDPAGQWPVHGQPIAVFPSSAVRVGAGEQRRISLRLDARPLKPWWPHEPNLYVLELALDRPGTDVLRQRVGFRELWTDRGDLVLNGSKVHLLATSWWPPREPMTRSEIRAQLEAIKGMHAVCFRTHTQPWRQVWYDVADEVGLMMIPEGAVWNDDDVYRVHDPRFWKHYGDHLQRMVCTLRNHASVVMWSLENEFYGPRAKTGTPAEKRLAELGLAVKREDPTRPILYESDGDPGGVADVIGLHYPNEYPTRRLWPDDAFWMDKARLIHGGGGMFWNQREFLWDRRKPLYIGEYLWVPPRDPGTHALLFGDDAYRDHDTYRTLGKALAWRMQILAYRHYGVSGQSPWTVIEHGALDASNPCWVAHRDMYRPLAAFVREFDSRFFSGDTVQRTVLVFNDTMRDQRDVAFRCELVDNETVLARGDKRLSLTSGGRHERTVQLPMPKGAKPRRLTLRLSLHTGGTERFREQWPVHVFPRRVAWPTPGVPVHLYDPKGRLRTIWQRERVAFVALARVQDWNGKGLLVVGPEALADTRADASVPVIGGPAGVGQWLARCVEQGGRVLVVEQTPGASAWLPVRLTQQASTMAFAQTPSHPILRGLDRDALRWWRGDHRVTRNEPVRPTTGAMRALVVTGTAQGISHAPLVEIPQGRGVWLICQLLVVSKIDTEPIARRLLERMIAYLAEYTAPQGQTVCLGPASLGQELTRLGVAWSALSGWGDLRWPNVRLLVMQSDQGPPATHVARWRAFVDAGGQVLWHRPKPDAFNRAAPTLGLPVTLQSYTGPALRTEDTGPLVEALAREDLYWLGRARPYSNTPTSLATDVAEGVFGHTTPLKGTTVPAARGAQLEGALVEPLGDGLAFYSAGRAHWHVDVPATGQYVLGIVARGTPLEGVYPMAELYLDTQRIGIAYIGSPKPATYTIPFHAKVGRRRLTLAFSNDACQPPEDRNLFVDRFVLARRRGPVGVRALTMPGALVEVPVGRGRLILSTIRWDAPGRNALRARRFICSLLTALGARSRGQAQLSVVQAETLRAQPDLLWFRRNGNHVYIGNSGFVHGPVHVKTPGSYRIWVWAKGTAVEGTYPIVALSLDDHEVGEVECASDDWTPHRLVANLPKGQFTLRVRFTNDQYEPDKDEDRNLWLDRIEFEKIADRKQ